MELNKKDIEKLARLSRLSLKEEEKEEIKRDLNHIFALINALQKLGEKVDMDKVEPLQHPQDRLQFLRDDTVIEHNERDKWQRLAPEARDGFYLVPKVIE